MIKLIDGITEKIKENDGLILSTDTLKPEHLIPAFLSVLEPCDEIQEILYNPMNRDKSDICADLWDILENIDIGIDEYVFSASVDDGACIGWFNVETF